MIGNPEPVYIIPPRNIAGILADAVIEEKHLHELVITDHPVEQGSVISDHAYKLPMEITVTYFWSMGGKMNSSQDPLFLIKTYDKLLNLQISKVPFKLVTGKKIYKNMMMQACLMTNDQKTEYGLLVRMTCREVIMAITQTVTFTPAAQQLLPNKTASVVDQGTVTLQSAPNFGRP